MKFLIKRVEVLLLFSVCRTMLYDLCNAGILSHPIKWNGAKKAMFCLDVVAIELAMSNGLEPPNEETMKQFRESILYLRRLELMEAIAAKKAKKSSQT